jgi:predicted dehydrogenase
MTDPLNQKNNSPLRGAVIGFGNVAIHAHLPVWEKNDLFRIDAVVETESERALMARKLLPEARIYATVEEMLADGGLDFVDICTPPCFHADLALTACRSGLHVFCEKPLATSVESLKEIEQAAVSRRKVVFTVNNWKYAPIWVKARELVQDKSIGAVRSVSLNVLRCPGSGGGASDWRKCIEIAQGGILIDHGWHNLYLILSLMQDSPVALSAKMATGCNNGSDLEETVDLMLRFRNAEAKLHLTWQADCRRNFGTVVGDNGSLSINDDHIVLESNNLPPVSYDFAEPLSAGSHHPEWMEPVVEDFGREIMNPEERGANLLEAQWCAQIIQLAYHSHKDASSLVEICVPAA